MISQFLIGPQFPPGPHKPADTGFVDVFAPHVYIKNKAGKLQKFQMFVYLGFKTIFVMLLNPEAQLTNSKLRQLHAYLSRQVGVLSQLLDQQVSRPLPSNDESQVRFFYFSKMNLAIKIEGLLSKEVMSLDLKHILN